MAERGRQYGDDRRERVLRAATLQVLWTLALVYLILLGLAFLFGREIGYDIAFPVCFGIALLVTAVFLVIHTLDRVSVALLENWRRRNRNVPLQPRTGGSSGGRSKEEHPASLKGQHP